MADKLRGMFSCFELCLEQIYGHVWMQNIMKRDFTEEVSRGHL